MRVLFATIFSLILSLNGFSRYNQQTIVNLRTELRSAPDSLTGKIYSKLFSEFYSNSAFDSAKAVAEEGIRKGRSLKDKKFESNAMVWSGMVEFEKGNYDDALAIYIEALKIKEGINDLKGEASLLLNMAGIYYEQNHPEKAVEIYSKALNIKTRLNDKAGQANVYIHLGNVAESQKKLNDAVKFYEKGEKLAEEIKDSIIVAICDGCMANIYLEQGKIAEAENLAFSAYKYLRLKRDRNYTRTLILLGKVNLKKGTYYKSKDYLEEALQISKSNSTPFLTAEAAQELAETYEKLKEFDKSLFFQRLYSRISDSLQGAKLADKLAAMQVKYETEKKEKAIEHLDKENSRKELEITKKRDQVFYISAILICVIALFVAFYFYSNFKRHQVINRIRHQRQKEIIETIITTEEKARKKIAADLHDGLGQILTAAKMNLANLNESLPQEKEKLQQVTELVSSAVYESKNMALNLMPLTLKENGLVESIRHVCAKFNKPDVQEISFNSYNIPDKLEPVVEINTYRICQELLNNAVKYSKAPKIFIQLFCRDSKLIIQVEDNGIGFDKTQVKKDSLGMNTLKERVALLQGEIEIDSAPQKGTNIFIELSI
ncbi:MAG: tetratricopeptide repeat-containing sensor histidine kinase [Bacteroidia bacterium]